MALIVSSLALHQFRNYVDCSLSDLTKNVIFVGENAVGKTNILEAISLMTAGQTFRHAYLHELVKNKAEDEQAHVAVDLRDEERQLSVEMSIVENKRQYKINGKTKKITDICGWVPAVTFTPDDLLFMKGGHRNRRVALDALGEQVKPSYQTIRIDYETVLKHKNKLLKDGVAEQYLASINDVMVTCGAQLSFYRSSLFDRLAPKVISHYSQLSQGRETLACVYTPSWEAHGKLQKKFPTSAGDAEGDESSVAAEITAMSSDFSTDQAGEYMPRHLTRDEARAAMKAALDNRAEDEYFARRAIIGPHADEITFYVDGANASNFASQGQQRTIVLAWKLAEVELIGELLDKPPILLLDDVMSELDGSRREALETCIAASPQTFITTTNLGYFTEDMLSSAQVISLPFSE